VRFGLRYNEDPYSQTKLAEVPEELKKFWESKAISKECHLNDGKIIEVSTLRGPAFAYGMGGGDPEVFFKLRVNDGQIYYAKTFYSGRGTESYPVAAIYYQDGKLLECPTTTEISACQDETVRLTKAQYSEDELIVLNRDKKRSQLAGELSPFCQAFPKTSKVFDGISSIPTGFYSKHSIDIDNNGSLDDVVLLGNTNGYFDGSYLMLFQEPQKIPAFLQKPDIEIEGDSKVRFLPEWRAYFISIGQSESSARYVYNEPMIYNNKTYIVASESNRDRVPSKVIGEMLPDHTVKILCQFP
jgi:hypothetical protein